MPAWIIHQFSHSTLENDWLVFSYQFLLHFVQLLLEHGLMDTQDPRVAFFEQVYLLAVGKKH